MEPKIRDGHALVFGGSGLAGWGVVNQLLSNYPEKGVFSRVTACTNRPVDGTKTLWPAAGPGVPTLNLVSGLNLSEGTLDEFASTMKHKVESLETVTHVFYFALKSDSTQETEANEAMLKRVVHALEENSPRLKSILFPSGTRAYGIYNPGGSLTAPLTEAMAPPASTFPGGKILYHAFRDHLAKQSAGKTWTWSEVRPDAVIGYVPGGSAFNLASHWGTYLALYALVEGAGAKVPYPGTEGGYNALYNEVSSDMIGKLSIWCSLNREKSSGEIFNVADRDAPSSMSERWPRIAGYFGLEGVAPLEGAVNLLTPTEFTLKHKKVLEEYGVKASEVFNGEILDRNLSAFSFDRQMSLEKCRGLGFKEEADPNESWFRAFDRYRIAGMLPMEQEM